MEVKSQKSLLRDNHGEKSTCLLLLGLKSLCTVWTMETVKTSDCPFFKKKLKLFIESSSRYFSLGDCASLKLASLFFYITYMLIGGIDFVKGLIFER